MLPHLSTFLGTAYFWLFAVIACGCSLSLLVARHPINGALSLIGVMLSLSGLYAILESPFVAVIQILVYAGAIMMLLVFVMMVLNHARDHRVPRFDRMSLIAIAIPILFAALMLKVVLSAGMKDDPAAVRGSVAVIAQGMMQVDPAGHGWYLLFEIGGLLLLSAVVGAVLLAKRGLDRTAEPGERMSVPADHGHETEPSR